MSLFQMHPFVQHFNGIMRHSKLFMTFSECAEALRMLDETLHVGVLSSIQVYLIQQEFPGLKKIAADELYLVWRHFSTTDIDRRASRSELLLKANYFLSYLTAVRRLLNLSDESLISGAQRLVFSQQFSSLSGEGELAPHLFYLYAWLYGGQQAIQPTVEQFTNQLEADFASIELAYKVVCGTKIQARYAEMQLPFNLLDFVNFTFKKFNKSIVQYTDIAAFGCENQMKYEELCDLMNLTQKYLVPYDRRVGCNALAVLTNITQQLNEILQGPAITELLVLVAKAAEVDIFNIQDVDKAQYFAYYFYMIVGELRVFTEEEFYFQAATACNCLASVLNFAFPQSLKCKTFESLLTWFYSFLKPHSYDKINQNFRVDKSFEIFDKDLAKFIRDIGGVHSGFKLILQLWLLGKSLFEGARSIIDLVALFLYETLRANGAFQEKIAFLSEEARYLSLVGDEYDVQVLLSKVGCMIAQ